MAERVPHQRTGARGAVVPLPGHGERLALSRLLPSGRSLLLGFTLLAGAAGLYLLARETSMFALQRIEVRGAPPRLAARVQSALVPLEGKSLLALDGSAVERRLTGIAEVAGVTYDRAFPHTLRVTIRPEHPVAVARRGANAWLVSARGRVLAAVPARTRPALPRVWLAHSGDPVLEAPITDRYGLRAVRALAVARLGHFRSRIRAVRARPGELTFLLGSGLELRLGDLRAVGLKLAVAARVLPRLRTPPGYAYLDVSVPERPVAGSNPQPLS